MKRILVYRSYISKGRHLKSCWTNTITLIQAETLFCATKGIQELTKGSSSTTEPCPSSQHNSLFLPYTVHTRGNFVVISASFWMYKITEHYRACNHQLLNKRDICRLPWPTKFVLLMGTGWKFLKLATNCSCVWPALVFLPLLVQYKLKETCGQESIVAAIVDLCFWKCKLPSCHASWLWNFELIS